MKYSLFFLLKIEELIEFLIKIINLERNLSLKYIDF